uniref:(California timema) hypothetical protein n=1 Tax=Timema californicum TaxID=61474 RepID=A0A7R9IZC3_TIMCA|nr:unnamed protein product [Timema californicum]
METPRKHQYRHSNFCHVGLATLFKVTLKLLQTTSTLSKLIRNTLKNYSGGGVENVPSVIPDRDANPYVIGSPGYRDIGALPHGATKAVLNVLERLWGFRLFFLVRFWAEGNDGFDELLFCAWLGMADHHYSSDSNILERNIAARFDQLQHLKFNTKFLPAASSSCDAQHCCRYLFSLLPFLLLERRRAVRQREPIPVLREDEDSDDRQHVGMSCPRLQGHCDVTASRIDDSLRQNGSEFGHHILVFVYNHFGIQCTEIFYLGASVLSLLDKDHGGCNKGTLTNKIDRIIGHGVQQGNGFFKACASTCDPQSHRSSVARDTTLGHCSGVLNSKKPSPVTAARRTSSFTSETATWRSLRIA